MTNVWRLNIKTASSENRDPHKFCINRGILGVGWPVDSEAEMTWDHYYTLGENVYYNEGDKGWWPAVNAIKNRMQINDLCWMRDRDGIYYLGRITSGWIYRDGSEYREADVVNTRKCDWKKVGTTDSVSGKVVNSFIPSRTVQALDDDSVRLYSQYLFNALSEKQHYSLQSVNPDLFSFISSDDCEDIVGIFLQEEKRYRMIPSSCKADTAAYEFVLKHIETGKTAVAQVKQGYVHLNSDDYSGLPNEVYLFTTHGEYTGSPSKNVHCLDTEEMRNFALSKKHIMSDRLQTWIKLLDELAEENAYQD